MACRRGRIALPLDFPQQKTSIDAGVFVEKNNEKISPRIPTASPGMNFTVALMN